MPCYYPQTAFQPLEGGPITWRERQDMRQLEIPCNQCIGCRLRRSAEWATRCMHEAKMHTHNAWLTLTYDDEHLPARYYTGLTHPRTKKPIYSGTLHKEHTQKFLRSLRKALAKEGRKAQRNAQYQPPLLHADMGLRPMPQLKIRYYYGGEYGEKYERPHYHLCLFGIDFADKIYEEETETGYKLYSSPTITKLWKHGQHMIGELTWESAAYTARYIMKKITGKKQEKHYEKIDMETGEIINKIPEYNDMSRRPGIAKAWLDKYMKDVYPHDQVIVRGNKTTPPRYYDKQYAVNHLDELDQIKFERQLKAKLHWEDQTRERLKAAETVTNRRIQSLKQKF